MDPLTVGLIGTGLNFLGGLFGNASKRRQEKRQYEAQIMAASNQIEAQNTNMRNQWLMSKAYRPWQLDSQQGQNAFNNAYREYFSGMGYNPLRASDNYSYLNEDFYMPARPQVPPTIEESVADVSLQNDPNLSRYNV